MYQLIVDVLMFTDQWHTKTVSSLKQSHLIIKHLYCVMLPFAHQLAIACILFVLPLALQIVRGKTGRYGQLS